MKRILLLSGTGEGPLLARALVAAGFQVCATVTRAEAKDNLFGALLGQPSSLSVEARGFSEQSLTAFLGDGETDLVLDATHPFAVRITRIAKSVCESIRMPYIRYERPDWTPPAGTHFAASYTEAAAVLPSLGCRPLLTIGAKQLKHFVPLHGRLALFARILPSPLSLRQAVEAGFTEENLLRLRPPFSVERNRELFRQYNVDVLVTKASGREGGVVEKVTAARELAMKVLMIRRPEPIDPRSAISIDEAVCACRAVFDGAAGPSGE
ncbi:MAG TPA: precorrin-6A reductase [Gemmataceae bacterium]|nr:precorrin-6A reductase [Gemmataceae bacterium]